MPSLKLLFSARFQSEKLVLKKNNRSKLPINQLKEQFYDKIVLKTTRQHY
jgi:hypothetical protein